MNAYFICVIVRVQMWCVCAQSYVDQTEKFFFFYHFICIWKCFLSLFVFKFCTYFVFQCFKLVFVLKNRGQSLLRVICELFATWLRVTKMEKSFLAFQQKLSQVSHEFATRKIPKSAILWVFHEFLVQNSSYDSFMTPSSPNPLFQSFYIQTQLI